MNLVAVVRVKAPGGDGSEGGWIAVERIYFSAYQVVLRVSECDTRAIFLER